MLLCGGTTIGNTDEIVVQMGTRIVETVEFDIILTA